MGATVQKLLMVENWKGYETNMGIFNQLDSLLRARARVARELGRNPESDEAIIEHIDYLNALIKKLINIPQ